MSAQSLKFKFLEKEKYISHTIAPLTVSTHALCHMGVENLLKIWPELSLDLCPPIERSLALFWMQAEPLSPNMPGLVPMPSSTFDTKL